jgi:hypothetical protein
MMVEKPITLYREFTTTITKEKPIINYKVMTLTDTATKTERQTVTRTATKLQYKDQKEESGGQNEVEDAEIEKKPKKVHRTVSEKCKPKKEEKTTTSKETQDNVRVITVTKEPCENKTPPVTTKTAEAPTVSTVIITKVVEPIRTSMSSDVSVTTITKTVEPKTQRISTVVVTRITGKDTCQSTAIGIAPKKRTPRSATKAISRGCEVSTGESAPPKIICRFGNVPAEFMRSNVTRKRRRPLLQMEQSDEDSVVVTTTIFER